VLRNRLVEILPRFAHLNANASQILQELLERSGILRRPQYGTIDFIHRTFLEYMAARAAIGAGDIGALVEGASDESWRETVVFAAGHAKGKSRADLVEELLRRPWFRSRPLQAQVTAACCLETVGRNLDPQLLTRLRDLARNLFPPAESETARILAPAAAMEPELLQGHTPNRLRKKGRFGARYLGIIRVAWRDVGDVRCAVGM
jgi:hypothetical protein